MREYHLYIQDMVSVTCVSTTSIYTEHGLCDLHEYHLYIQNMVSVTGMSTTSIYRTRSQAKG